MRGTMSRTKRNILHSILLAVCASFLVAAVVWYSNAQAGVVGTRCTSNEVTACANKGGQLDGQCVCQTSASSGAAASGRTIYNSGGLRTVPEGYVEQEMQRLDDKVRNEGMTKRDYLLGQCDLSPNQAAYESCREALQVFGDTPKSSSGSSGSAYGGSCTLRCAAGTALNPIACKCEAENNKGTSSGIISGGSSGVTGSSNGASGGTCNLNCPRNTTPNLGTCKCDSIGASCPAGQVSVNTGGNVQCVPVSNDGTCPAGTKAVSTGNKVACVPTSTSGGGGGGCPAAGSVDGSLCNLSCPANQAANLASCKCTNIGGSCTPGYVYVDTGNYPHCVKAQPAGCGCNAGESTITNGIGEVACVKPLQSGQCQQGYVMSVYNGKLKCIPYNGACPKDKMPVYTDKGGTSITLVCAPPYKGGNCPPPASLGVGTQGTVVCLAYGSTGGGTGGGNGGGSTGSGTGGSSSGTGTAACGATGCKDGYMMIDNNKSYCSCQKIPEGKKYVACKKTGLFGLGGEGCDAGQQKVVDNLGNCQCQLPATPVDPNACGIVQCKEDEGFKKLDPSVCKCEVDPNFCKKQTCDQNSVFNDELCRCIKKAKVSNNNKLIYTDYLLCPPGQELGVSNDTVACVPKGAGTDYVYPGPSVCADASVRCSPYDYSGKNSCCTISSNTSVGNNGPSTIYDSVGYCTLTQHCCALSRWGNGSVISIDQYNKYGCPSNQVQ